MTATTERCPGCHGSGIEMSGVTYAGMSEYVGCHECGPECPDDCGCRVDAEGATGHGISAVPHLETAPLPSASDVRPVPPALVSLGYDADSRLCRLLADKAALLGDVDRLTAERDRARGLAATLEAENARLREGIERMASEMQRGRLIPGTPVFGCAACGMPTESEPCRDHDEGLQHAGDMLRALLADTDSALADGGDRG